MSQRRAEALPVRHRLGASASAEEFDLAAWVRRSTAARGLPEKLADEDVILAVARLLLPAVKQGLTRPRRRRSVREAHVHARSQGSSA
jgi:hypothetical protein